MTYHLESKKLRFFPLSDLIIYNNIICKYHRIKAEYREDLINTFGGCKKTGGEKEVRSDKRYFITFSCKFLLTFNENLYIYKLYLIERGNRPPILGVK